MTTTVDRMGEFYELVGALCQGTFDAEQAARLEALVLDDAELRRRYIVYMHVHANAEKALLHGAPTNETEERTSETSVPCGILYEELPGRLPSDANPPASIPPIVVQTLPSPLSSLPFSIGGWPMAYLIASVVFAIGLAIAAAIHVSQPVNLVRPSPSLPSPLSPLPSSIVARVSGMVDCVWEDSEFRVQGAGAANQKSEIRNHNPLLHLGDTLALRSGLLEITYDTGAKVILQGPVTYEVDSPTGGFLSIGKLTAKLEKKSEVRGQRSELANQKSSDLCPLTSDLFAIRTPTALVTDLGTEFGVEVDRQGWMHTRVFVGSVRVEKTIDGQNHSAFPAKTLVAGESAEVRNERDILCARDMDGLPTDANRFVRSMPTNLNASDSYANMVLSMNPAVYCRMDDWPHTGVQDCCALVDSAPGGNHGVVHVDKSFGVGANQGRIGNALNFHGLLSKDHAFIESYPRSENGQLSVSAWVWVSAVEPPCAAIVANWYAPPSLEPTTGQFALGIQNNLNLIVEIRQKSGKTLKLFDSNRSLSRSQWQHVAFVADGRVLHLYHDGAEIAAASYDGIAVPLLPKCLSIGCEMNLHGSAPRPENAFVWNGRIDELAVFNHALTVEQIRRLGRIQGSSSMNR